MIQNLKSLSFWEYRNALLSYAEKKTTIRRQRPYHVENTVSRLITAVNQRWAWLVLGWVTAWEHHVLLAFFLTFGIF